MAHFAEIDSNNRVLRVVVIDNLDVDSHGGDQSEEAASHVNNIVPLSDIGVKWVQTSYNNNFRKKYAGVNDIYDPVKDKFITPQPHPSWTLNTNDDWEAPIAFPSVVEYSGLPVREIIWDEDAQKWRGKYQEDRTDLEWNTNSNTWVLS
jgi:hypothetical protein